MALEFTDPQETAIEQEYFLKCTVVVKEITYRDYQSKGELGNVTEKMVFLKPHEGTQRDLFYSAWLPEYEQDPVTKELVMGTSEVTCKAGHPIYGFFKCSVHRADERMREPHLFVMTKSSEEELKHLDGKDLIISILPASQYDLGDNMKDYELAQNKNI